VKRGGERYLVSRLWRKSESERLRWRRRQRAGGGGRGVARV